MSSQIIADFQAEAYADVIPHEEPKDARIVMNHNQIVAAFPGLKIRIDQEDIIDVVVKQPVIDIDFIDTVLTIAYKRYNETATLLIGAPPDRIKKFRQILFSSLLKNTRVCFKHPARIGGRVIEKPILSAKLRVASGELNFCHPDGEETIAVADVTDFNHEHRKLGALDKLIPVINVQHFTEGKAQTSFIGTKNQRELHLIGRYMRVEYSDLCAELSDLELDNKEIEALVTLYSGGDTTDITQTVGVKPSTVETMLDQLETTELITEKTTNGNKEQYTLTEKGRIIVNQQLVSVNI